MTTFDEIVSRVTEVFHRHSECVASLGSILVNRDLNARVRLILGEGDVAVSNDTPGMSALLSDLEITLGPHSVPIEQLILREPDLEQILSQEFKVPLEGFEHVYLIDRLATEGNWSQISPPSSSAPRIVFFSIKGGVGRSTALAATAWSIAQQGQRVLILDLDLESPGVSSSLLPADRRPKFGIADWLVEDLVGNGDVVTESMVATSALARDGEIFVVPAHGADPGEYIAKLGRVWMPKVGSDSRREPWSQRLGRLLDDLERRWRPDIIFIDSRAGIDEVASTCLTDIGASTILLFAIDGDQTWSGYRILFKHWRKSNVVREIRERLQLVGAMIPDTDSDPYFAGLREQAWDLFSEELYDEIPAGVIASDGELWNFDETDESAPHYPWRVRWHRGFAAVRSMHGRLELIDAQEVNTVFGPVIDGIKSSIAGGRG